MALIKCPECGKEISDKAAACINCGCPVSAMKTESTKAAASAGTAKPVSTSESVNSVINKMFSGSGTTWQVRPVPKEKPEPGFFFYMLDWAVGKACGVCGLAGVGGAGMLVVDLLQGYHVDQNSVLFAVGALLAAWLLGKVLTIMKYLDAKRFIRKNGYEDSIRYDSAAMTNSLNAFGLYASKPMAKYIGKLNPAAGSVLEKAIRNNKEKKRKERLGYLPYLAILGAVYYLLPNYGWMLYLYEECLIIAHVVTFVVMFIYGYKKTLSWGAILAAAALFAPTVIAYFGEDMWYHILICAALAFVGMYAGINAYLKKK